MKDIILRPLTDKDVIGAAEIKVNGWKTAYNSIVEDKYLNSLSVTEESKKFKKCVGKNNFIVATIGEKVVGFCRFINDNSFSSQIDYADCELTAIYVHPDFKCQGIGSKMFEYVLNEFYNQNKNKMILWCIADNVNSIKFYKHMGGEIKESKLALIGNKKYEELGFVYNVKELYKTKNRKKKVPSKEFYEGEF